MGRGSEALATAEVSRSGEAARGATAPTLLRVRLTVHVAGAPRVGAQPPFAPRQALGGGLEERDECVDDGRGAFVAMTEQGRAAIERAAPGHARTVRRLMFDQLSDDEVDTLGDVLATVLTQLSQRAGPPGTA